MAEYGTLLQDLTNNITLEDLEQLKSACKEDIPSEKSEAITTGRAWFSFLESHHKLDKGGAGVRAPCHRPLRHSRAQSVQPTERHSELLYVQSTPLSARRDERCADSRGLQGSGLSMLHCAPCQPTVPLRYCAVSPCVTMLKLKLKVTTFKNKTTNSNIFLPTFRDHCSGRSSREALVFKMALKGRWHFRAD